MKWEIARLLVSAEDYMKADSNDIREYYVHKN
jgi:hypothetical protein